MSNPLNPLLAKTKLPGKVYQLPSKGLFYPQGVLADHIHEGEIEVKPMSALTELKIRSADLLYSTKIIREICLECAPDVLQPEKLLARDVDALFTFLIVSTYGMMKSVRAIHDCATADWHDYSVNLEPILANPNNAALAQRDLLYQVALPNGQTVHLKPVAFSDSIELMSVRQAIAKKELEGVQVTHQDAEALMLSDLLAVIKSVETGEGADRVTVDNRILITEWLRTLPKRYFEQIAQAAATSSEWGFRFQVGITCKDCKQKFDYDLELNPVNFFTG